MFYDSSGTLPWTIAGISVAHSEQIHDQLPDQKPALNNALVE